MKALPAMPPATEPTALRQHVAATYFSLRAGLALLAVAFPIVLYGYGRWRHGLDLQPSMSAYFWAATAEQCAVFPMRTLFVGFLFAIGVGLHLYKGITRLENVLLNSAGVCAAVVAVYPERLTLADAGSDARLARLFESCPAVRAWAAGDHAALPVHYLAAVALFVLLALVAWRCASGTLAYLPPDKDPAPYRRTYRLIAVGMLLFPVPGVALAFVLGRMDSWVFFVEAAGILMFGLYWTVKTRELSLSRLEAEPDAAARHAVERQRGAAPVQRWSGAAAGHGSTR